MTTTVEPPESDRDHLRRRLDLLHLASGLTDQPLRDAIAAEMAAADRLHRQLVAVRAEADGWAEALRNADRLYDQHLAEVRATEQAAARRLSADGIRRVAAQSGWSGWAADYIHPDVDFDNDAVEAEHRAREEAIRAAALTQAAEWFDRYDTGVAALLRRMASDDTLMQASLAAYSTPKES